jgi:hypothetical protein
MIESLAAAMEFNLRSQPQLDLARWLEGKGVDLSNALNITGPLVEHDIILFSQGLFDFAEPGLEDVVRAVVQVAVDSNVETPLDLVAWTRDYPDRIYRCLGAASSLGIDQLLNPASYFGGRPLIVHRSPLAWLVAGCKGIVPLDYRAIRNDLTWRLPAVRNLRLAAESLAHGRALRDALAPLPARVRILVPRAEAA